MPTANATVPHLQLDIIGTGQIELNGAVLPALGGRRAPDAARELAVRTVRSMALFGSTDIAVTAHEGGRRWPFQLTAAGALVDVTTADAAGWPPPENREEPPQEFAAAAAAIVAAVRNRDPDQAVERAAVLSAACAADFGKDSFVHLRAQEIQAHLLYITREPDAAGAWLDLGRRWATLAQPDCWHAVANAHHCWAHARQDPAAACALGERIADAWRLLEVRDRERQVHVRLDSLMLRRAA